MSWIDEDDECRSCGGELDLGGTVREEAATAAGLCLTCYTDEHGEEETKEK